MEEDEYLLTEADVMDALRFVVAAETRDDNHHHNHRSPTQPVGVGEEEDARTTPLTKPLANPYHNRQKQELVYLKRKVCDLERELQVVEKENDTKLAQATGDSLWQRIAQQQNLEKQKVLSENARLKEMLEGQIKFAKSLEKAIRKRPNLTAFGSDNDAANHGPMTSGRRKKRRSSVSLYEELSESAEREFARTNEVLQSSGLAQMVRDHRSIEVAVMDAESPSSTNSANNNNVADLRVDWMIVRRYPFPFHAVARELWKILSFAKLSSHVPEIERSVDRMDDTLYATTTLKVPVASTQYSIAATALIRQYVEDDSFTVVWVSDGECVPTKGTAKDTFKLYETGWTNIQPAPNDPTSCVSRTLGYFFPTFSARSRTDSPTASYGSENEASGSPTELSTSQDTEGVGVLTELLAQVYERSASHIHTAIENALMAEAVSQNRTDGNSSELQ